MLISEQKAFLSTDFYLKKDGNLALYLLNGLVSRVFSCRNMAAGEKRREDPLLLVCANKLEKGEKTLGTRLIKNRLIVSFYPLLIVADGFYKTKRWFCDKVRTFIRLR